MIVEPLRLLPERGVNLDLRATLRWAHFHHLTLSLWGAYQIDRALYDCALAQIAYLESGAIRYKAVDAGCAGARVTDCIHVISDLATGTPEVRLLTPGWGALASEAVTQELRPWLVAPSRTHDWVAVRLGLNLHAFSRGRLD